MVLVGKCEKVDEDEVIICHEIACVVPSNESLSAPSSIEHHLFGKCEKVETQLDQNDAPQTRNEIDASRP